MRLLQCGGESGIRTHEGLHPTAFRERHFRPLRHLSTAEYSISPGVWQASYLADFTLFVQPAGKLYTVVIGLALVHFCVLIEMFS